MSYESGSLNAALEAAIGDDIALMRDLRRAFLESADRQLDLLARAQDEAAWRMALWRLKGLCGSFGVIGMMVLVEEAESARPGDDAVLSSLRSALVPLTEE